MPVRRSSAFRATYADVAEMLDRERPDVLDVATPPEAHAAQARMAAERGVHILCQKPMTPDLAESERLVTDVGDRVRFMVHENWRFRPQYRQAAAWLAAGPRRPRARVPDDRAQLGARHPRCSGRSFAVERQPFFAGLDRFLIMEVLIHHLDTVRYLAGPLRVTAAAVGRVSTEIRGRTSPSSTSWPPIGAPGSVTGNFSAAGFPPLPSDRLELVGENGTIAFESGVLRLIGPTAETVRYDFDRMVPAVLRQRHRPFRRRASDSWAPFETDRIDNLNTLRLVADAYRLAGRGEA